MILGARTKRPSPSLSHRGGRGTVARRARCSLLIVAVAVTLLGCAAPARPVTTGSGETTSAAPTAPKRVIAAIIGELTGLGISTVALAPAGGAEVLNLVNSGLVADDPQGVHQPQLAEAVPSLENGRWKLLPDGGMELSWTIRPNVQWHDGHVFTSDDLLFSLQLLRDRDLPVPS